jgi:hypothetical protein
MVKSPFMAGLSDDNVKINQYNNYADFIKMSIKRFAKSFYGY